MSNITISVVATVYNECHAIQRLLDSFALQTRRPDEVIICDGGSTDGTQALIRAYNIDSAGRLPNLRLIIEPGANISRGRNVAIRLAIGPIIAVTDAGVRLADNWLENLVAPWEKNDGEAGFPEKDSVANRRTNTIAVAGFFAPDVKGIFQTAMAGTVLPLVDDIDPDKFLPSSRSVAFTKEAWQKAGGYPEWLDYCEDLLFDFAINKQQPSQSTAFVWRPDALVYFRPRESLLAFWQQYYLYARGDGKADLWRKRHIARYVTYLILLPLLLVYINSGGWVGLTLGMLFYCKRPWQRLRHLGGDLSRIELFYGTLLIPVIRLVGDVAKMVGYPMGLWWRWHNRHRTEIHWHENKAIFDEETA